VRLSGLLTIVGGVHDAPVVARRERASLSSARCALDAPARGPSTSPLEARLATLRDPLRAAVGVYVALGLMCFLGAAALLTTTGNFFWGSAFFFCLTLVFFSMGWLSYRYLVLSHTWRIVTLAISALTTLLVATIVGGVALSASSRRGELSGSCCVALLVGICTYLLWRQQRASNNRSRGP